jgi:hypothetical protein
MTLCIAGSAVHALGGREFAYWAKQKESEVRKITRIRKNGPLSAIVLRQERSCHQNTPLRIVRIS